MKKIKDYSIIETEWIENRIVTYKNYINDLSKDLSGDFNKIEILRHKSILSEYEVLKSKLKPLIPIVEASFDAGWDGKGEFWLDKKKQDYINNTIIK